MPLTWYEEQMDYFSRGWHDWWYTKTPRRGLYGSFDDAWFNPKYSSVARAVAREENPLSDPSVRRAYAGTRTSNPFKPISHMRLKGVVEPRSLDAIKGTPGYSQIKPDLQANISSSIEEYVKGQNYSEGLRESQEVLRQRLQRHYERTQRDPVYASVQGRWDLEKIYRTAKMDLHSRHQEDATQSANMTYERVAEYLRGLEPADFPAIVDDALHPATPTPPGTTFDSLDAESKNRVLFAQTYQPIWKSIENELNNIQNEISTNITDPEQKKAELKRAFKQFKKQYGISDTVAKLEDISLETKRNICARKLLEPMQKKEEAYLEKSIDLSRSHYIKQHDKNCRWARICEQQRETGLLEAAQKIHDDRCREILERARQKRDDELKKEGQLFSIHMKGNVQELSDDILLENNEGDLPTFEDFQAALQTEEMKSKNVKFRFARNHYLPFGDKTSWRNTSIDVTFRPLDGKKPGDPDLMCVDFSNKSKLTEEDIRRDPEIRDACEDIAESIWASFDQKNIAPEKRTAVLVATSEAHADVLYRAALMRGFKKENITMHLTDDINTPVIRPSKASYNKESKEARHAEYLAEKYKHYVDYQSDSTVAGALRRIPDVGEGDNELANAKDEADYQRILSKQEQEYNDTVKIFNDIINAPAGDDRSFALAVDKLNTLKLQAEKKGILGWVAAPVFAFYNTLKAGGYLLMAEPRGAADVWRGEGKAKGIIAVKDKYSPKEREEIVKAAIKTRDEFIERRDEQEASVRSRVSMT